MEPSCDLVPELGSAEDLVIPQSRLSDSMPVSPPQKTKWADIKNLERRIHKCWPRLGNTKEATPTPFDGDFLVTPGILFPAIFAAFPLPSPFKIGQLIWSIKLV